MNVTIDYIARMAGVSKATVSRVINGADGVGDKTRQRVLAVIDHYEYRPNLLARGMATSKTRTIGLIIPDITNPFFPALVKAVEQELSHRGYTLLLCNTGSSPEIERQHIATMIANRVDGVLLASAQTEDSTLTEPLKKYNTPCVLIDRCLQNDNYACGIFVDNEYSIFLACEYLLRHGNQRIAFISGPAAFSTSRERVEGYTVALRHYGVPLDPALVTHGLYTVESGYAAIKSLQGKGVEFTAVLAANDTMAIGAVKALKESGHSVPWDVEVIGFDNIPFADLVDPPLTTVGQPVDAMGKQAVGMLLQMIDGEKPAKQYVRLNPKLILRATTRPDNA